MKNKKKTKQTKFEKIQQEFDFLNRQMMLLLQTMQHWGAMQQDQDGNFLAIFDPKRNMPCAWLNTEAHCENSACNWNKKQCVFTGLMSNCEFYEPVIETPKES